MENNYILWVYMTGVMDCIGLPPKKKIRVPKKKKKFECQNPNPPLRLYLEVGPLRRQFRLNDISRGSTLIQQEGKEGKEETSGGRTQGETIWEHTEKAAICKPRIEVSSGTSILQLPELWKKKLLWFKPLSLILGYDSQSRVLQWALHTGLQGSDPGSTSG